jgi:transposase
MKKEKRSFDKEFKLMAVELCHSGKSTKEVADDLGVRRELIARWKRESNKYKEGSFSGHGNINMTDEQKENTFLKKALKESQLECEILKKAVGIFSRKDGKFMSL